MPSPLLHLSLVPLRPAARAATVLLSAAVLLFAACGGSDATEGEQAAGEGGSQTSFRLASLEGGEVGPGDYAGKTVLIDFWATWCIPCHAQAEVLKGVYPQVKDRVQFLAVDVGEEETQVRGFVERKPFPYPVLLDEDSEVADSLGVYSLPTLMIIGPDGEVSYFEAGVLSEERLCEELSAADEQITC